MIVILVAGVVLFFAIIFVDRLLQYCTGEAFKDGYHRGVDDMEEIYEDTTIKDLVTQELIKQKGEEKA